MASAITLQKKRDKSDQNSKQAKGSIQPSIFIKRKREPNIQSEITKTINLVPGAFVTLVQRKEKTRALSNHFQITEFCPSNLVPRVLAPLLCACSEGSRFLVLTKRESGLWGRQCSTISAHRANFWVNSTENT